VPRALRFSLEAPWELLFVLDFLLVEAYLSVNSAIAKDEAFRSFSSEGASVADSPSERVSVSSYEPWIGVLMCYLREVTARQALVGRIAISAICGALFWMDATG
jgi:hypothetical protein